MRSAILSDIHGNSAALKAVLAEVREEGIDDLIIAGDFSGYYYRVKEVLELLSPFRLLSVAGNHDALLCAMRAGNEAVRQKYAARYGSALTHALKELDEEEQRTLCALPETHEFIRAGKQIFLCHGSPWVNDEYVYPDAPQEKFDAIASLGHDIVIMGHTHYPLIRRVGKCAIVNPGSVGQPRDKGSSASWVIADFAKDTFEQRRTLFDAAEPIADATTFDPSLPYLVDVLLRKR